MRISKRRQQYLDKFKFPYHGQIFSSIKACCEYYDVAYSCVFPLKKEKNITAEKAIDHLRAAKKGRCVKYHGQTYPSMKVCCELFNVPVDNVSYYKRTHKCSFEAALDHYVLNESRYSFKFNNQKYPSIIACCKEYGLSPSVVYAYKNKNQLTPSAAIRACLAQKQRQENQIAPPKVLPKKKKKKVSAPPKPRPSDFWIVEINGEAYPSLSAFCKQHHISHSSVAARAHRLKCTIEESANHFLALQELSLLYPDAIQFQNSTYDCVERLCSRIGVDPIAILHFVKSKQYTLEQAIQEALSTTGMHRVQDADPVVFQNTVYPTLYRCYHALQIDARSVKTRMEKYHMSWEEAVEDAIKCKKTSDK